MKLGGGWRPKKPGRIILQAFPHCRRCPPRAIAIQASSSSNANMSSARAGSSSRTLTKSPNLATSYCSISSPSRSSWSGVGPRRARPFSTPCRHRGGPLVREPRTSLKTRLVCQYHSWSYDLEGRLRGVPESENFANLNRGCLGLGAVHCDSWAGMVFINFARNAGPLREFLAPIMRNMDEEIGDGAAPHQSRFAHKSATRIRGNWKLPTDANLETYHVNTVHRRSLTPVLDQKATTIWLLENGHSRMFIGQHRRVERNLLLPRFPKVNPITGEGQYAYLIYPNTILGVSETMIFTAQAWPLGPGEMRYDAYYLTAAPLDDSSRPAGERMFAATERILQEDLGNLTFMQNSFEAG